MCKTSSTSTANFEIVQQKFLAVWVSKSHYRCTVKLHKCNAPLLGVLRMWNFSLIILKNLKFLVKRFKNFELLVKHFEECRRLTKESAHSCLKTASVSMS